MMEQEFDASKEGSVVYPMKESWDILIVLDACRYDYLAKVYSDYVQGTLSRRISPGTWTLEWADKVFRDTYQDCVYVSANPFIGNSNDVRYKNLINFKAREHFYKILDVWQTQWDTNSGTVRPESVNEAALEAMTRYPNKRLILHYMQPHYPYLILREKEYRMSKAMSLVSGYVRGALVHVLGSRIGNSMGKIIAPNCEEWVAKKIGVDRFRQAYEDNLRIVLSSVSTLLQYLNGRIIITADHGELLGEHGKFGHPVKFNGLPQQTEIPWLEITSSQKVVRQSSDCDHLHTPNQEDEDLLRKRLQAFGYE